MLARKLAMGLLELVVRIVLLCPNPTHLSSPAASPTSSSLPRATYTSLTKHLGRPIFGTKFPIFYGISEFCDFSN